MTSLIFYLKLKKRSSIKIHLKLMVIKLNLVMRALQSPPRFLLQFHIPGLILLLAPYLLPHFAAILSDTDSAAYSSLSADFF